MPPRFPVHSHRSKAVRSLRYLLVAVILTVCVGLTVRVFDWRAVGLALRHMRVDVLALGEVPLLALIFALRGWRWMTVLGIHPTGRRFVYSFCANGVSAGLAALTPFQLGEAIKIRMIPDRRGGAWRLGVSAFFTERILDLCGMISMGLYGLLSHLGWPTLALLAPLLPVQIGMALALLSGHVDRLPQRLQPYTEALRHASRIVRASVLTSAIWLSYAATWLVVTRAMNLALDFAQVSLLLGGVMLAVVASMTPGGLGVSELSSRGIMLWLGSPDATADATAVAIRVLTPIIALAGLACLLPLWRHHRAAHRSPTAGRI
jgi:uncharacterized membrane protein YbhN (UPF0104 family)